MSKPDAKRILIVEDEWLIADDLVADLRREGYETAGPVSSVAAALDLLEKEKISAAVLDINLRQEKCFPLAHELARRAIPFVFVTGYSESDLPPPFKDRPLLLKPAATHQVRQALQSVLPR